MNDVKTHERFLLYRKFSEIDATGFGFRYCSYRIYFD